MNKKIFLIIAIVIIVVAVVLGFIFKDDNKTDIKAESEKIKLNNEYKYLLWAETKSTVATNKAPSYDYKRYYEIDLEKNLVQYKQDCTPTGYGEKEDLESSELYTGRIIDEKNLTKEESKQLKELLDKAIYEGSKAENKSNKKEPSEIIDTRITDFEEFVCYRVSNKDKENVGIYNVDDQKLINSLIN